LPYTTLFRSVPDVISGSAAIALCAALVAGAITLAAYARGSPTVSPAASRFAGGLLITAASSILYWLVPLPDLMCERRLYLPLVGAALSLSGVLLGVRPRGPPVAAGEYRQAIDDLQMAVAANPGLVRARINLGIARIDAGDLAGAEAELRAALAIEPRSPRALTNLAEILRANGRASEAVALYHEALDADPTYSHAAARLGVTLETLGDRRGALDAYREFLVRGTTSSADRDAVLKKVETLDPTHVP